MNNMYGNPGNVGMYQPAPPVPIEDIVSAVIQERLQNMVRSNMMSTYDAQTTISSLSTHIPTIANNIRQTYAGYQINQQHIVDFTVRFLTNYLTQRQSNYQQPMPMMQQPQFTPSPMNQVFQQNAPGQYLDNRNNAMPQNQASTQNIPTNNLATPIQQKVVVHIDSNKLHSEDAQNFAMFTDPHQNYSFTTDNDYLKYSTVSKHSGNIVDVTSKGTIVNNITGERVEHITVDCRIIEPCVEYVINKFLDSNPALTKDHKWVIDIDYGTFILKKFKYYQSQNIIDISDLNKIDISFIDTIRQIISSINSLPKNNAEVLESIIIHIVNDRLARFLTLHKSEYPPIQISDFNDVIDLFDSQKTRGIVSSGHPRFIETVFNAFKAAVLSVIFKDTQYGPYDTGRIAPELIASPKFVIRDNGLYEREADFDTEEFINAVKLRYTAFGMLGNITVMNFIPDELDIDSYHARVIGFERSIDSNPLIWLFNHIWKDAAKTILIKNGDNDFIIKNGVTMDDKPFIFRDKMDLQYGL